MTRSQSGLALGRMVVPIWALAVATSGCIQRTLDPALFACTDAGLCAADAASDRGLDAGDAASPDGGGIDGGDAEVLLDPCAFPINLEGTNDLALVEAGATLNAAARVDPRLSGRARIRWEMSPATSFTAEIDATGRSIATFTNVEQGRQTLRARVVAGQRACDEVAAVEVAVCRRRLSDGFTSGLSATDWLTVGSAFWSDEGIVSLNALAQGQQGALVARVPLESGDVSLRFRARIGLGSGADGLAASLIALESPEAVAELAEFAAPGEGLGYAAGGRFGAFDGSAVTLELDTYFNSMDGGNLSTDPTFLPHVQVTQNLDPGQTAGWFEAPTVNDYAWHTVRLDVVGNFVRAFLDGVEVIEAARTSSTFAGGFLFFSASTGSLIDHHDIDDVEVFDQCR